MTQIICPSRGKATLVDIVGARFDNRNVARVGSRTGEDRPHRLPLLSYIFGAFQPTAGEALRAPHRGRTTANWVNFREQVAIWLPPEADPVYAIIDNLRPQNAPDVLPFSLPIRAGCRLLAHLRRLPEPHQHGLA